MKIGCRMPHAVGLYEGECVYRDSKLIAHGKGKFIFVDGASYEGDFRDGKFDGQGKFVYAEGEKQLGTWKCGERDGIIDRVTRTGEFHEVFCHEGREESISCMSAMFYGEDGLRIEFGLGGKRRILLKTEFSSDSREATFSSHTDYYIYGPRGGVEKIIRIDYNKLNTLANEEIASFDELIAREAIIDVTEGLAESEKIRTFGAAKEYLRRAVRQHMENTGQLVGKLFNSGGGDEITNLLQLTHINTLEQFKFMRFANPGCNVARLGYIYGNLETFLGALGISTANLENIKTDFITLSLPTANLRHRVSLIINIGMIKKLVTQQHRQLSDISENVMLCFDSSRVMNYQGNGVNLGGITKYCRFVNQNLQKYGVCWLYAAIATLLAARNPALVERLLAGRIQSYDHGEGIERSGLPNEFEISVLQLLREVAAGAGMALVGGYIFSRNVVRDEFVSRLEAFSNDQALIRALEIRINIALGEMEKECGIEFDGTFRTNFVGQYTEELSREIQPLNLKIGMLPKLLEAIDGIDQRYMLMLEIMAKFHQIEIIINEFLEKMKPKVLVLKENWLLDLASRSSPIFNAPGAEGNPSQSAAGLGQGSEMLEVASQALDHSLGENLSHVPG
ncbi:MAG: hypothetical protein LBU15_00485 [Rickettsiales bacterium]|nr:hypothetical protein [Rickettsiales bacterium]